MGINGLTATGLATLRSAAEAREGEVAVSGYSASFSFGIRHRLNAAAVRTNNQSTFSNPRNFTLRIPAIAFIHPNVRSISGRFCWLTA